MKQPQILVLVPLMIGLAQSGVAQSSTSPTNTASSSQTKQDKKAEESKPKSKSTKAPIKADTGKKTTTSQDAAYAVAARKGIPDHETTPPK
jgi:hypothetical protein